MKTITKIKKLSEQELQALANISINIDTKDNYHIYKRLEKKGLITKTGMQEVGRDAFGSIRVPRWEMPLDVHIDWCKYCSELEQSTLSNL